MEPKDPKAKPPSEAPLFADPLPKRSFPTTAVAIAAVAGFACAGGLRRFLDYGRTRSAVLAISGLSATILILHSLFG